MAESFQHATPLEALTPPSFAQRAFDAAVAALHPAGPAQFPCTTQERLRLLDRVRRVIRTTHYSRRTERAYVYWVQRFVIHHGDRHPDRMGADEVRSFLSHLAVHDRVTASTQNQALCALVFLYGRVLGKDVGSLEGIDRAKAPKRLPVVLTRGEVKAVLAEMKDTPQLVCRLLYGAGLRLGECLGLRVKDIDFEGNALTIRNGKGAKDRITVLPASCRDDLARHLERVLRLHEEDLTRGFGRAPLPFALAEKYPHADRDWGWQYVFPASSFYTDRSTGTPHRHHLHETVVQKAMGEAVRRARLVKPATPHTLRHYAGSQIMPGGWLGAVRRLGSGVE